MTTAPGVTSARDQIRALRTEYERWREEQRVPVHTGEFVPALHSLTLGDWSELGCRGAIINIGEQEESDCRVLEIGAGATTHEERHLFEEICLVLSGTGATTVTLPGRTPQRFTWSAGDLFSPPLNFTHWHENTGDSPARLVCLTSAPIMLNLLRDRAFVFANDFEFLNRYDPGKAAFDAPGGPIAERVWKANVVRSVDTITLDDWSERGAGSRNLKFSLANNNLCAHISEFGVGTYKLAHRHAAGAHIVVLAGEGYSLFWRNDEEPQRVDWRPGIMMSPAAEVWHQHFNVGARPARYVALRWGNPEYPRDGNWRRKFGITGGEQVTPERERPAIRELFVRECAKRGVRVSDVFIPKGGAD